MYTREITLQVMNKGLFPDDPRKYKIHCQHCPNKNDSSGLIVEKITQSVITLNSGVVGHNSSQSKSMTSVYFCNKCGNVFMPTKHNEFGILHEERMKKAEMLFELTYNSFFFSADLTIDQIVEIDSKDKQPFINVNYFKKDTEVWPYIDKEKEKGSFLPSIKAVPYIVNDADGKRIVIYKSDEKIPLPPIAVCAVKIYHPILDKDFYVQDGWVRYIRKY